MVTQDHYESMLAYVRKYHDGQLRNKNDTTPYWMHCYGVAHIVQTYTENYTPDLDNTTIVLAALGHDLYEDTQATRDEVRQLYGDTVDQFIFGLTNEHSDSDRDAYMEKMRHSPEEVIIVKMADMAENMQSVYYSMSILGNEWLASFFMPIMNDSIQIVRSYDSYEKYGEVARQLLKQVEMNYEMLRFVQTADDIPTRTSMQ